MTTPAFQIGDFVRLKEPIRIGSGLSPYRGQRGEVVRVLRRTPRARPTVTVRFTKVLFDGALAHVHVVVKPGDLIREDQR
jgi:hypothetical protein